MGSHLTFNATTKLWSITTGEIVAYPSTVNAVAGGPFDVVPTTIKFDPVHKTGGAFWLLNSGPNAGYFVSAHTNDLGYGSITVTTDGAPTTPGGDIAHINPLADWRVKILGVGGAGSAGTHALTFVATTMLWTRTSTGIIKYPSTVSAAASGPYKVNPVTVPFDPIHQTGGSFWELKEGPNIGYLVSAHSNSLGYGNISVTSASLDRGPGAVLAILYHPNPHLAGATKLYNKAGEFHMTLLVDDPNVLVPVPKLTHYVIEFWNPDTSAWVQPKSGFAGMIWDIDATDTEVVFYGIDYLALLQFCIDERFDPSKPDRPVPNGSKYVAKTITYIVTEQLNHARLTLDSPVGFIGMGSIATMNYKVTIYSTLQITLDFIIGLLNSHRAGTSKLTELRVENTGTNTYAFVIEDNPGIQRPALTLEYGVLAQGYQIRKFGRDWASRVNMIGRDPTGKTTQLQFQSVASPQMQALWGRIAGAPQIVESIDKADMKRRALQAAIDASRIGRQLGVGTKLGSYRPFEAYNLLDMVPVVIEHGGVHTSQWINDEFALADTTEDPSGTVTGTWAITGIQWESYDDGHWLTTPLLYPKGTGKINYGNVQGAFAQWSTSLPGSGTPSLPHPTTPGHILIAIMLGTGNTTVFPTRWKLFDDPVPGVLESTDWTVVGLATKDYTGQNIGGPGATAGIIAEIAWRRVFDSEKTQTPVNAVAEGGSTNGGVYLYEVPETVIPEAVTTLSAHVAGNPEHFVFPTHVGNLLAAWVFPTSAGHSSLVLPTVAVDSGVTKLTDADETNNPSRATDANGNLHEITSMASGGIMGVTVTPNVAYTSLNTAAVMVKLPDGVVLPAIPYPANQVEGSIVIGLDSDGSGGTPPPPANGSGYGPPGPDTQATSTYTDLLTGQQYTYDPVAEAWVPVAGTSYSDSGFYVFTFTAATTWTINHTLGAYPSIHLVGSDGHEIEADVNWVSSTQIVVTFTEAVAGTATLR